MTIPGYRAGLDELRQRESYPETFFKFCDDHRKHLIECLEGVRSCLSVGPGYGDVDSFIIHKFLPNLDEYFAIEPNPENFVTLHENIGVLSSEHCKMTTHLYKEDANGWGGVGKQVDVILCFAMLYHIKDVEGFLKSCHSWLKPGGILWLTVPNCDVFIVKMAEILSLNRSSMVKTPPSNILNKLCFQSMEKYAHPCEFDLKNADEVLLRIMLYREPTKEETCKFQQFIVKQYGEGNCVNKYSYDVFICKK